MSRRFLFYLILAVFPLTVLAFFLAVSEGREEEANARSEEKAVARVVSADIDRLFQLSRGVVSGLTQQKNEADICRSLQQWRSSYPELLNIGLFETYPGSDSGRVVCGQLEPPVTEFPLTAEEARIAQQVHPGELVVLPVRPAVLDGEPVIPVAGLASIEHDGARRLVAASVRLDLLSEEVNRVAIPEHAVLLVLDRKGIVVAHNPPSPEFRPGAEAPKREKSMSSKGSFDGEIVGEGGVSRFYVLSRIGSADGLSVVLKIRSSDIFRQSRERLLLHLAGILTVSGFVFGIAWSNTNRHVIRPLRRVIHVAEGVAAGRLSERTGLAEKGEIGRLARTFDIMADALQREKNEAADVLQAVRALTARVDSVAEEERTRIAREIHDELGQQLTAMRFELARLDRPYLPDSARVQDLIALVEASTAEVRKIATELRPVALDYGGLGSAIEWLASEFRRRSGVECVVQLPPRIEASPAATTCLFRICQESLTNVVRHAHAGRVDVVLTSEEDFLTLTVRDDGRGFHPTTAGDSGSLGVLGMRERARIAGGTLRISSSADMGTVVSVRIPARRETSLHAATG